VVGLVGLTSNSYILLQLSSDETIPVDISKYTEFIGLFQIDSSKKEKKLIIFACWLKWYLVPEERHSSTAASRTAGSCTKANSPSPDLPNPAPGEAATVVSTS